MKVRTYIALLSVGSLLGASLLIGLGWWGFASLSSATRELEKETQRTGELSVEYKDVEAFLSTTRNIMVSMEVYPENYEGLFGVTRDKLREAEIQLNVIASKYGQNYSETELKHLVEDLAEVKGAVLKLEEFAQQLGKLKDNQKPPADFWVKRNKAKAQYEEIRDKLKQSVNDLEILSEQFRQKSEQEVLSKWQDLKAREETNGFFLLLGVFL
ncbi:MAG: hypothetical protein VX969_03560, partial [Verrucomicrobiota bacterium]|nr:hypothetical protein [Verrucomicrobiota bacterium]